jgi:hypothetical protein
LEEDFLNAAKLLMSMTFAARILLREEQPW